MALHLEVPLHPRPCAKCRAAQESLILKSAADLSSKVCLNKALIVALLISIRNVQSVAHMGEEDLCEEVQGYAAHNQLHIVHVHSAWRVALYMHQSINCYIRVPSLARLIKGYKVSRVDGDNFRLDTEVAYSMQTWHTKICLVMIRALC